MSVFSISNDSYKGGLLVKESTSCTSNTSLMQEIRSWGQEPRMSFVPYVSEFLKVEKQTDFKAKVDI